MVKARSISGKDKVKNRQERPSPEDPNPRNAPVAPLDPTPPQENLPDAEAPTVQEQDHVPVDPKTLIHPPPDAPEVRRERVNG
jgi:hypothetical protein